MTDKLARLQRSIKQKEINEKDFGFKEVKLKAKLDRHMILINKLKG